VWKVEGRRFSRQCTDPRISELILYRSLPHVGKIIDKRAFPVLLTRIPTVTPGQVAHLCLVNFKPLLPLIPAQLI
jgi:hypothetical protein